MMLILGWHEFLIYWMKGSQVTLWSKITPRILTCVLFTMEWLPMMIEMFSIFFFWLKSMKLVFSGASRKPDIFDQDIILSVESCRICYIVLLLELRQMIVKSSAYKRGMLGLSTPSEISLIAIRNSVTDMVEPWGTPFSWKNVSDRVLEILT